MYWRKNSLSVKSGLSFACWYWTRKRLNSDGVQSSITAVRCGLKEPLAR